MLIGLLRVLFWYAGCAALTFGVWQLNEPAAWIVGGILAMAEAIPWGTRNAPESD